MPRSGSTFLHELLAQDPRNRAPRVWEVMFPLPAPDEPDQGRRARVRKAAACLWCFRQLAPGADSVYPIRAQTPHECVAIHSYTLEFVSRPLAVVERVYQQLGLRLSDVAAHRMEALVSRRTRYRPRRAAANTAWLWTELAGEAGRFERYCARFGLSCRPVEVRR